MNEDGKAPSAIERHMAFMAWLMGRGEAESNLSVALAEEGHRFELAVARISEAST